MMCVVSGQVQACSGAASGRVGPPCVKTCVVWTCLRNNGLRKRVHVREDGALNLAGERWLCVAHEASTFNAQHTLLCRARQPWNSKASREVSPTAGAAKVHSVTSRIAARMPDPLRPHPTILPVSCRVPGSHNIRFEGLWWIARPAARFTCRAILSSLQHL